MPHSWAKNNRCKTNAPAAAQPLRCARLGLSVLAGFLAWAAPALACVVCIEQPQETLADRIWAADSVVFARSASDDPFRYTDVTALKGGTDEAIPFMVNSVERKRMERNADWGGLVLYDGQTWSLAAHGGADLAQFITDVLRNETHWRDSPNDPDRLAAFADLQDHKNTALRRTALTELSRVPYADLREVPITLQVDWIVPRLSDGAWFGWKSLFAQMLGLHPDPRAHDIVRQRAQSTHGSDRVAWWVAWIEREGAEAMASLSATVTNAEEVRDLAQALRLHATADTDLAPMIASTLKRLATQNPVAAGEAVHGLQALGDFSFVTEARALLEEDRIANPDTAFALRVYLAQARRPDSPRLKEYWK